MKKNIIIASILTLFGSSAIAGDVTTTFKASANIEATCNIETGDINFGVVALPLTTQSASGDMRLLCSKSTAYTIDLTYGGVYGTGKQGDGNNYTVLYYVATGTTGRGYLEFQKNGKEIGRVNCLSNNMVQSTSSEVTKITGISTSITQDVNNYCGNTKQVSDMAKEYGTGAKYSYGVMNGLLKSDKLAYKITVPNDSTKVWNKGINNYRSTGTGIEENIVMNAQIVPESSSSRYVAADNYMDTVTATVTY